MAKQGKQPKTSRRSRQEEQSAAEGIREPKAKRSAARRAQEAWTRQSANPLVCMTEAQSRYLASIRSAQLTFGIGPAGTGKTYVCTKFAAMEMDARNAEGITFVRPIVEAGGGLGYLPGDEAEKTAPYQVPILEILTEHFGASHLHNLINGPHPKIGFVAPEYIRGRTFRNQILILDEAQNMTPLQMKTFLTRIGEGTRVIVNGDIDQVDIRGLSGLRDAMDKLKGLDNVAFAEFTEEDIVRSGLVKDILMRYRSYNAFDPKKGTK